MIRFINITLQILFGVRRQLQEVGIKSNIKIYIHRGHMIWQMRLGRCVLILSFVLTIDFLDKN
jgi:hypothetical protein